MIVDTNFLSALPDEQASGQPTAFLGRHRDETFDVTVISAGEIAVIFESTRDARGFLDRWHIIGLKPEWLSPPRKWNEN